MRFIPAPLATGMNTIRRQATHSQSNLEPISTVAQSQSALFSATGWFSFTLNGLFRRSPSGVGGALDCLVGRLALVGNQWATGTTHLRRKHGLQEGKVQQCPSTAATKHQAPRKVAAWSPTESLSKDARRQRVRAPCTREHAPATRKGFLKPGSLEREHLPFGKHLLLLFWENHSAVYSVLKFREIEPARAGKCSSLWTLQKSIKLTPWWIFSTF